MFASAIKEQAGAKEHASRKDRVRSHLEEANRNGKAAAGDLDAAAHAVGKDVRDFIESAIDSASDGISQAKEKISDTTETITSRIKDRPLSSAAIAMGIGVFLGVLLRRR